MINKAIDSTHKGTMEPWMIPLLLNWKKLYLQIKKNTNIEGCNDDGGISFPLLNYVSG